MRVGKASSARLKLPVTKLHVIGLSLTCCLLLGGLPASVTAKQASEDTKAEPTKSYTDPDGYQIYAALLTGEKASSFVIQAETESSEKTTVNNLDIRGDHRFTTRWGAALRDLAAEYRAPKLLSKSIPLTASYEIVSVDTLNEIFNQKQGWARFSQRYPSAHGYYSFSPVGFNPTKTRAVVWTAYSCAGLCGGGTYHFFEKKDGSWREVSVNAEVPKVAS